MHTQIEKDLIKALERIELSITQTRIANTIGRKSVKKREAFWLFVMDMEQKAIREAIDRAFANSKEEAETRPQANASHQEPDTRAALEAILKAFDDGELLDLNDAIEASRAVLTKPKLFHVWSETDGVTVTGALPERDARRFMDRYMETWRELDYYLDYSGNRRPLEDLKLTLRPVP